MPKSLLHGIVPPVITPLTPTDALDAEALVRVINHAIGGGVNGLFMLGTTGEFSSLSGSVRRDVIRAACGAASKKVPVVVGVTDTSVAESAHLARFAADAGADAIVLSTPYYLPLSQDEVIRYVRLMQQSQPLPVLLYNFPALTKTPIEPETVRQLADDKRVIGLKDSSGDLSYLQAVGLLVGDRTDFSLLVGRESLMVRAVQIGVHGCVGGGGNIAPQLLVELFNAASTGDPARIEPLEQQLELLGRIYRVAEGTAGTVKGTKYAASRIGLCDEKIAEPFLPLTDQQRRLIDGILLELKLIPHATSHNENPTAANPAASTTAITQ